MKCVKLDTPYIIFSVLLLKVRIFFSLYKETAILILFPDRKIQYKRSTVLMTVEQLVHNFKRGQKIKRNKTERSGHSDVTYIHQEFNMN